MMTKEELVKIREFYHLRSILSSRLFTREEAGRFSTLSREFIGVDTYGMLIDHCESLQKQFEHDKEMKQLAIGRIDALQKQVADLESGFVHTCHDKCMKPLCVKFREKDLKISSLEAQVNELTERLQKDEK